MEGCVSMGTSRTSLWHGMARRSRESGVATCKRFVRCAQLVECGIPNPSAAALRSKCFAPTALFLDGNYLYHKLRTANAALACGYRVSRLRRLLGHASWRVAFFINYYSGWCEKKNRLCSSTAYSPLHLRADFSSKALLSKYMPYLSSITELTEETSQYD